ncbi:retrotransposon ORF1 [Tanacetum coccineum]
MDNTNSPPVVPPSFLVEKVLKLNSILESLNLKTQSSYSRVVCKKEKDSDVMLIKLIKDNNNLSKEELDENDDVLGEEEFEGDHFDKFLTRSELVYHKYLTSSPFSSMIMSNPIIVGGNPLNLKIPCNIGNVHVGRAYINLDSPLNIMSRGCYNWIMTTPLEPRKDSKSPSGINNFTGRVRGMPIFVGNFTYVSDFMIVEDISSVIDPRLSPVVLGKPFVELSDMTYDLSLGVVKFTKGVEEISYKMPHKIEQYDSLSDMKKENMKSVYFRNEDDKRKGVEYVMSKILGFYKECLELGPEYRTRLEESTSGNNGNQGGVTQKSSFAWGQANPKCMVLGRYLEEIHVTWAQFWKKPDKMANGYEEGTKNCNQNVKTASGKDVTPSGPYSDDV